MMSQIISFVSSYFIRYYGLSQFSVRIILRPRLQKIPLTRGTVELAPGAAIGMTVGPQIAKPEPAPVVTMAMGTAVHRGVNRTGPPLRRCHGRTHERPVGPSHLLGRAGHRLDRPAVAVQTPERRGGPRQCRRQHQRLLGARIMEHHPPTGRASRRGRGAPHGVPPPCLDRPPGPHPLRGGLGRCGGHGLPLVRTRQRTDPLPSDRATSPACGGGEDRAPRRHMAGDPGDQAWDARRHQGRHATPGVDDERFVGGQRGARWRDGAALQRGVTRVVGVGLEEAAPQGAADVPTRPDRRHHRQDDSREGLVRCRVGGRADAPTAARAAAADEVTGHRAAAFITRGLPAACPLDHPLPRRHEGLTRPASIRQRGASAAHGLCRQAPVGQRWEAGTPTPQDSPRNECPAQPEQPKIRPDGPLALWHSTGPKCGQLSLTSGRPPRVECDTSTLPEHLPEVALTIAIYRKLKHNPPW